MTKNKNNIPSSVRCLFCKKILIHLAVTIIMRTFAAKTYCKDNQKGGNNMSYSQAAQLEIMNAVANVATQEDLDALRLTLSLFFAERAQKEIDRMWDDGTFNQAKLDELRGQHLRTPYRTV